MGSTVKSIEQINEKIRQGQAVVVTAEDVSRMAAEKSAAEIAREVDVVTTATFGPMCSSGAFLNFGHYSPPIRMEEITLNDVPVSGGLAAVDTYVGATSESHFNNRYGGAHVIEDLIAGKDVRLKARAKGTDCYPTKEVETLVNIDGLNEFYLFNPRNAYQNYGAAVNTKGHTIYTYMGMLLPDLGNATYSTSGELSPLLNDPQLRTIGIGTRIFLGGAQGYVSWYGTQFNTSKEKNEFGVPTSNAATLAVIGDAKQMSTEYLKAAYFEKYGVTMFVGIGIPIPMLNEQTAQACMIRNSQIYTQVIDYSEANKPSLAVVDYQQLRSGTITVNGRSIKTAPLSSLLKARKIAAELKRHITEGDFYLTSPVQPLPSEGKTKPLKQR
ncbi:MAG: homocysteine biosynthesis protein [Spirochaetota bacterium]